MAKIYKCVCVGANGDKPEEVGACGRTLIIKNDQAFMVDLLLEDIDVIDLKYLVILETGYVVINSHIMLIDSKSAKDIIKYKQLNS
jgi:hypothetical protein